MLSPASMNYGRACLKGKQAPCHTRRLGEWCNDMQVRSHLESYLRGSHLFDKWKISENGCWWEEVKWKYEWWLRLLESKAFNNEKMTTTNQHENIWASYRSPYGVLFLLFRQIVVRETIHWLWPIWPMAADGVSGLYFVWLLAVSLGRLDSRANMMNTEESC